MFVETVCWSHKMSPLYPHWALALATSSYKKAKLKTNTLCSKVLLGICFKGAPPWQGPLGAVGMDLPAHWTQSFRRREEDTIPKFIWRHELGVGRTNSNSWHLTSPFKSKPSFVPSLSPFPSLSVTMPLSSLLPQMSFLKSWWSL